MAEESIAWLQRADTTVEDLKDDTAQGAIKALREFDWKSEWAAQQRLGEKQAVAPSLGLGTFGDDHFINIVPKTADTVEILYAWKKTAQRKILGLFKASSPNVDDVTRENVPFTEADDIIRAFYQKDAAKLAQLMGVGDALQ